jgi:hypothetical protein
MARKRWSDRKVPRKATPAPKRARRRHIVVTHESARTWWDGSKSPHRRRVDRGRGGIVQGIFNWIRADGSHAGRSRGRSWW